MVLIEPISQVRTGRSTTESLVSYLEAEHWNVGDFEAGLEVEAENGRLLTRLEEVLLGPAPFQDALAVDNLALGDRNSVRGLPLKPTRLAT